MLMLLLKGSSRGSKAGKACTVLYSSKSDFIMVVTKTAGWSKQPGEQVWFVSAKCVGPKDVLCVRARVEGRGSMEEGRWTDEL